MTRDEEIEYVRQSLENEKRIKELSEQCKKIRSEEYPPMRKEAPEINVERIPYPNIESGMKFNKWWFLLVFWVPLGWIVLWLVYRDFNNNREKHIEKIRGSEEYRGKCREVDAINAQKEKEAQRQYDMEMEIYQKELFEYNKKKAEWERGHTERLEDKQKELDTANKEADFYYRKTSLIPKKYHSVVALEYIYEIVGYSQYTFKEAAQDYENYLNRKIETARLNKEDEIYRILTQMEIVEENLVSGVFELNDIFSDYSRNATSIGKKGIRQMKKFNKMVKERNEMLKERMGK